MADLNLISQLVPVRIKPGFVDDPDFVVNQDIAGYLASNIGLPMARFQPKMSLALSVVFLDGGNIPVTGARGSYSATPIMLRTTATSPSSQLLFDGRTSNLLLGYKRYILGNTQLADNVGVRLTNIVPPPGATQVAVYGEPLAL